MSSLLDDEHDRLLEIEALTTVEDPWFVARLDLDAVIRRHERLRRMCWLMFTLGVVLMLGGAAAIHEPISMGTVTAVIGAGLILWSAVAGNNLPARRP